MDSTLLREFRGITFPRPARTIRASRALDLLLASALFLAALSVRLPYLALVPPWWNSEISEALDAANIALGSSLPLVVPSQPHIGVVGIYPLALLLKLISLNPFLPRIFTAVCGALTVAATFALVRVIGSRSSALVAAALLAANPFHILINSHIFWTNSLTPLFTTLAFTALLRTLEPNPALAIQSRRRWLVLAFFLWSLALQSHPSVWALAPGILVALLLEPRNRESLRAAWTFAAPLVGLAAYSNVLVFNLLTNFASLRVLSAKTYALPNPPDFFPGFPERLGNLLLELVRIVSGTLGPLQWDAPTTAIAVWGLGALAFALHHHRALVLFPALSSVLTIAFFNQAYNLAYAERYVMFLVPLLFAMMALAVSDIARALDLKTRAPILRRGALAIGIAFVVFLAARSLPSLLNFYAGEIQAGRSNETYLAWNNLSARYAGMSYRVFLDEDLNQYQAVRNASDVGRTLEYLFRMNGVETQVLGGARAQVLERGLAPVAFALQLDERGTELAQQRVWLCLADDPTRRAAFIYVGRNGLC